jgi:hypothetical protein
MDLCLFLTRHGARSAANHCDLNSLLHNIRSSGFGENAGMNLHSISRVTCVPCDGDAAPLSISVRAATVTLRVLPSRDKCSFHATCDRTAFRQHAVNSGDAPRIRRQINDRVTFTNMLAAGDQRRVLKRTLNQSGGGPHQRSDSRCVQWRC